LTVILQNQHTAWTQKFCFLSRNGTWNYRSLRT